MENNWLLRAVPLYGDDGIEKLKKSKVAILGLGGVGSAVAEGICRSGVGNLLLVDNDTVDLTNINRQLIANSKNIGELKTLQTQERLLSINPNCNITIANEFYLPENSDFLFNFKPDFVIDAIDTVTAKLHLAKACKEKNIPLITCLGTGNRLDPLKLRFGDISQTSGCGCPLARVMRHELKKLGIEKLDVIYSEEIPIKAVVETDNKARHSPASSAFVPPVAGFIIASQVVKKLLQK